MIFECAAIFCLIFVVVIMYIRSHKKDYALATVPLLILPLVNVLSYLLSGKISLLLPMDKFTVYAAINIIAVIASSCTVGIMSSKFKRKATKSAYIVMSLIFNIVLAAILIYNMFQILYN